MEPVNPQGVLVGWQWKVDGVGKGEFIPIHRVATYRYDHPEKTA